MKTISVLFFVIASLVLFSVNVKTQDNVGSHLPEWKLVWHDEFNKDGRPDPKSWAYETGFVRNEELQWYQPENAWCEDGRLIIEARKEQKANPAYRAGSTDWKTRRQLIDYTSASLTTKDLFAWRTGRFELKARLDTDQGLWPAIWTLGLRNQWPSCGEIDILEYYRGLLLFNVAWGTETAWVGAWDSVRKPIAEFNDPEWSTKYHIWRMDWDEQFINLYLDDQLMNSTDLNNTYNRSPDTSNPFHQPHFIILNLAVGGSAGGDPSQTTFPKRFEIDYVRVYQPGRIGQ